MVIRLDVATPHQGGCKHADESPQVHDEMTLLSFSHIQRVLSIEFHDEPNTRILASIVATQNHLVCGMSSKTAGLWSGPKRERS